MKSKIEKVFVGGRYIPAPQDYYDAPIIRKDISLEQLEKEIKEEEEKSKHRNDWEYKIVFESKLVEFNLHSRNVERYWNILIEIFYTQTTLQYIMKYANMWICHILAYYFFAKIYVK